VLTKAQKILGAEFTQLYGLTETVGAGAYLLPDAHRGERLRSCGVPYPGFEMAVVDGSGKPVPQGEVGRQAKEKNTFFGDLPIRSPE
jgi:acyl-coenzyme A synthetase/AMP-(fatty) acid ligase